MGLTAAQWDARAHSVRSATVLVAAVALAYVLVLILVLRVFATPAPNWISAVIIPVPILALVLVALRVAHAWLVGAAAKAEVRAAERAIDDLERPGHAEPPDAVRSP